MKTLQRSPLVLPAFAYGTDNKGDVNMLMDPALRRELGLLAVPSGASPAGYNTEGDIITQTIDGVDLNSIWTTFQQTLEIRNRTRQTLINFLTYSVQNPVETVPQFGEGGDFEEASEFGVPKGMRTEASYFQMGFPFKWFDTGARYTWKFLADATAAQVNSVHQQILEADSRLVFGDVMKTLFRSTNRTADIKGNAYTVYSFYNADGTVPPSYKSNTFSGSHNHYLTSGAANVDSADLDEMQDHLTHHGYMRSNGADLVLMVNKAEADVIRNFRSIANGGTALYDFIPAAGQPSFLLPTDVRVAEGQTRPPAQLRGLTVIGAYGEFTIVQEDYIPPKYMVAFATGGQESLTNPIGIREHQNPALRGLRLVKARSNDYPLQDSYYQRGFGTGIRQRGAGLVMQVTANASYAAPAQYS
jgi:hypothetical protein